MKEIDEWFTKHPDYGVYRMTQRLNKDLGYQVNKKRIRRLYNLMGLQTIYRSIKYENIYINPTENGLELYPLIDEYMQFYNKERRHTRLDNKTPNQTFYTIKLVS